MSAKPLRIGNPPPPFSIFTLGCKLNQVESEAIADLFKKAGFSLVPWGAASEKPGLLIINTCTVTSKADQKARRVIRKALRDNPDACVIVTGCYAQLDAAEIKALQAESAARRLFVLGTDECGAGKSKSSLLKLPEYLAAKGLSNENSLPAALDTWAETAQRGSPFSFKPQEFTFHSRAYLKIQDGCDNACAYCRVRLARGSSVSLPAAEALDELHSLEAAGCAEVMITGVNITQYRYENFDLAGLLRFLLDGSRSIALRLSSLEPEGINESLAAVLAHPRIRPHFHLSVQSGSDAVLEKMGRVYNTREAAECAALLRSVKGNPFLACDTIAGFPGETEADFAQTIAFCENIGFAWIHAFPYSKRPGTAAFSMGNPVPERDITRRVQTLTALAMKGRRNYAQAWLGKELSAVVEKGKVRHPEVAGQCRAVSENYLKLSVNYTGQMPQPGSSIRCVPVMLCEGADGEKPDAVAEITPSIV
ncbi:MAG: tRNA (N(6)-L-threonylcarbamoyladenosine(37)-C(2))-methylthiotransferase MtaB [Treponema sp.]|nr:tRNA (N(6)-L-threonylcarbamoyladenosine(37)-C(2))-methylthiotransferase MtaB [Treponema sp.]